MDKPMPPRTQFHGYSYDREEYRRTATAEDIAKYGSPFDRWAAMRKKLANVSFAPDSKPVGVR